MHRLFPKKTIHKLKIFIVTRKALTVAVVVGVAGLSYWGIRVFSADSAQSRYVLASVQKETVVVSVGGSGQVSASGQVELKPKIPGDIIYIGVQNGQEVKAGALIAQIDARDAQKTVRDAEINLESAKLSLEKLKKPADNLLIIQSEHTLARAAEAKQNAENDLERTYEDGFNAVANAFLDLPAVMTGLQDVLFSKTLSPSGQWNIDYYANTSAVYDDKAGSFKADAYDKYQTARQEYDKSFENYKSSSRFSDPASIEELITGTYDTSKSIAEAVKSANNLVQFYKDTLLEHNSTPVSAADAHISNLNTYTGKTNTHLVSLLSQKNAIKDGKDGILNASRTIVENTESLAKLKAGSDTLDIQSAELTFKQRENALRDAKEKLADYFIRAPFDGVIASIPAKKGDSATSATSVATLITKQKLAEISLNEVDAAAVSLGQKATLTFDAVENLTVTGELAEIDALGTVSQGVVTYGVKIGFDTQDDRIKSGMSVSASIITDVKQNVLAVPNSAVKTIGEMHYVEILDGSGIESENGQAGVASSVLPRQQPVEIGIANDTSTEIISGVKEGDRVVARTINMQPSQQSVQSAPGFFSGGARVGPGGGAVRIQR